MFRVVQHQTLLMEAIKFHHNNLLQHLPNPKPKHELKAQPKLKNKPKRKRQLNSNPIPNLRSSRVMIGGARALWRLRWMAWRRCQPQPQSQTQPQP